MDLKIYNKDWLKHLGLISQFTFPLIQNIGDVYQKFNPVLESMCDAVFKVFTPELMW